jgi:hypothetical protein
MINNDEKSRTWKKAVSSTQLQKKKKIQSEYPSFQVIHPEGVLPLDQAARSAGVRKKSQYSPPQSPPEHKPTHHTTNSFT